MDNLIYASQGDPTQQQRVSNIPILTLKDILPSLPDKVKYSVSPKKALDGDRDWERFKEILGRVIGTHQGTLTLSYKLCIDIHSLLEICTTQRHISVKNLERLLAAWAWVRVTCMAYK